MQFPKNIFYNILGRNISKCKCEDILKTVEELKGKKLFLTLYFFSMFLLLFQALLSKGKK